jgi:hypothetical protein
MVVTARPVRSAIVLSVGLSDLLEGFGFVAIGGLGLRGTRRGFSLAMTEPPPYCAATGAAMAAAENLYRFPNDGFAANLAAV